VNGFFSEGTEIPQIWIKIS